MGHGEGSVTVVLASRVIVDAVEVLVEVGVVKLRQLHAELMTEDAMEENAAGFVGLRPERLVIAAFGSTRPL